MAGQPITSYRAILTSMHSTIPSTTVTKYLGRNVGGSVGEVITTHQIGGFGPHVHLQMLEEINILRDGGRKREREDLAHNVNRTHTL